jgi:hypothetical protein
MQTLRDRCKEILHQITKDAILRQGSSVETLMAFVQSEFGRTADERLDPSKPLVLYFPDDKTREQFIEEVRQYNPNFVSRKMP